MFSGLLRVCATGSEPGLAGFSTPVCPVSLKSRPLKCHLPSPSAFPKPLGRMRTFQVTTCHKVIVSIFCDFVSIVPFKMYGNVTCRQQKANWNVVGQM